MRLLVLLVTHVLKASRDLFAVRISSAVPLERCSQASSGSDFVADMVTIYAGFRVARFFLKFSKEKFCSNFGTILVVGSGEYRFSSCLDRVSVITIM